MPSYVDTIFLKREINWILYTGSFTLLAYIMYVVCVATDQSYTRLSWFGYLAALGLVISILCLFAIMISTYGVLKWNHLLTFIKQYRDSIGHHDHTSLLLARYETMKKREEIRQKEFKNKNQAGNKILNLRDILSTKNGLELFMNHLFQEFSYENLLVYFFFFNKKKVYFFLTKKKSLFFLTKKNSLFFF
ncbi:hypothetical protein RFI_13627 [Reticulomyxa filosa]|uniref:Uncharacterized protein n=1 Tax=Reticulomyxa filosa TaxID=46433 RepID=X6NDY1_RETFI|nr:hypothetical protein RFI_13627 [Reticulomyxa filosa]|eukprot:ETO23552.1 hypothetical protein RFI_13627 [Reticulomyxa filosa]